MPQRAPVHRPSGWRPYVKRVDPAHAIYGTAWWKATRTRIKTRDRWQCTDLKCDTPSRGRGGRLIVDHIVDRRDGGTDDDANLHTLCPACDNRKHGRKG